MNEPVAELLSPILQKRGEFTYEFWCVGCKMMHQCWTAHPTHKGATWSYNNNPESPTFSPSLKIGGVRRITDEEHKKLMAGDHVEPRPYSCHFFIRDGYLEYCSDCSHDLNSKRVKMEPIPEDDLG